jgi:hypothetical protein
MKYSARLFAAFAVVFAVLACLSIDVSLTSRSFAAASTAKKQCINTCRARYRDCRRLNQLPSSQCKGIYQDCTRYSCTGLGPG